MGLEEVKRVVQPELDQDFDALYEEFVAETGQDDVVEFLLHLHDFGLISEELITQLADDSTFAKQRPNAVPPDDVLDPSEVTVDEDTVDDQGAPAHAAPPAADTPVDGRQVEPPVDPIDWSSSDDDDWDEATVLRSAAELMAMTEDAKSDASATDAPPDEEDLAAADTPPTANRVEEPVVESPSQSSAPQVFRPPMQPEQRPEPPPRAEPTPAPVPRRPTPDEVATPVGGLGMGTIDLKEDDPESAENARKRTSFRRRDNGQLEETGTFKRQRRRVRRDKPKGPNDDRYVMLGMVGEGAMGSVLLADDRSLRRKIAYKEMSPEIADQPPLASKFLIEAQITAQLDHPNIVPVYDLQGDDAYTMKLIKGDTIEQLLDAIRERLKKGQSLTDDQTLDSRLEMFLKVCEAMAYAHSRGVVHRDLKPENVMIGEFGEVYVMDWGIAHVMPGQFDEAVTVEGMVDEGDLIIGTAGYMSPEQADARTDELTGASDQYALGLILFEMVSLKHAVTGKNAMHIITRHQMGEVDKLVHLTRKPIAPELAAIIAKATSDKVKDRYPNVTDMADDIRRFLRGEAVRARPDNPWQALVRFTGRHRQATLLGGAMVIMSLVFFVMLTAVYTQVTLSRSTARQQALNSLTSEVGRQASYVDGQLLRLEGLLLILSTSSEDMLSLGESLGNQLYTTADFDSDALRPPDTDKGRSYQMPVSVQHSAFVLKDESDRYTRMGKLLPMTRHFQKILLRSKSEDAAQYTSKRAEHTVRNVGTPIIWAYVALPDGSYDVYPGHGGYPSDFDPRDTSWYRQGARADGPFWGSPTLDEDGSGEVVVPCSIGLHDIEGQLIGVAGIDVDFDHIAEKLMPIDSLRGTSARMYIVDDEGRILIDPAMKAPSGRALFPNPTVVQAIANQKRSGIVDHGDAMTIYTRMTSLDWYYVVTGPRDELMGAMH